MLPTMVKSVDVDDFDPGFTNRLLKLFQELMCLHLLFAGDVALHCSQCGEHGCKAICRGWCVGHGDWRGVRGARRRIGFKPDDQDVGVVVVMRRKGREHRNQEGWMPVIREMESGLRGGAVCKW